ncbi:hypothetical protein C2G38_2237968 [Gigaspora rosea]|uniref:Uncharacterized protein n=1 Tax=Gigaspora rosea TaxID=44941 RepID=A0A397WB16_9GLOM|nr:hypothetical protein C2G38_2237968 [Gigaspora rosea]
MLSRTNPELNLYNNATKTNFGPCAIENCQYSTSKFRKFTELAAEKAQNSKTLSILEYSHLIPNHHQLCNRHYLLIVEPIEIILIILKLMKLFKIYKKTEKSSELKWDNIHLEILDDKVCISKQDFLNLVSNIEYLQKNQKMKYLKKLLKILKL